MPLLIESRSARLFHWCSTHRLEIFIFTLALVFRLTVISLVPQDQIHILLPGADGSDYANEASNILAGHGFSRSVAPPYIPDAIRTPLYPLALAGIYKVFDSFTPIIFFEAILSSLLPILFIRIAGLFVRNRRIVLAGALFLVFEPHFVFNTIFFESEGISIILLYWGLVETLNIAYKNMPLKAAALAGFILGIATLARPITTYIPFFILPLLVYWGYHTKKVRTFLQAGAIFLVTFILAVSPWVIRNYQVFGTAGMGTVGWFNVYTRLAATVVAIDTGDDFYTSYHKLLDQLSVRGFIKHQPPVSELEIQNPQFAGVLQMESMQIVKEHPRAFLTYLTTAPISVLTQDNTLGYLSYIIPLSVKRPPFSPTLYASQHGIVALGEAVWPYLASPYIVPYLMRALFSLLFLFAIGGSVLLWRHKERFAAILFFGFICYIVLFSLNAGGQIDGRYRTQFLLVETVRAAVALERLIKWRAPKKI